MKKRNLYLKNTPVEEAKEQYVEALNLKPEFEAIQVVDSLHRITSSPILAECNSPLCDSAAMDGIAVAAKTTEGASDSSPIKLNAGSDFIIVDTGDPVNPPFDAVIMAEDLTELADGSVLIRAAAAPWQHVRPVGEDIAHGEMILPSHHSIRPVDVGVLLSGGLTEIQVFRKPKVAIIPTGTEMIEPGTAPAKGQIIESNSRMFEGLILDDGGLPFRHAPVADDYALLSAAIAAAAEENDLVIVNAGSSAGTEDYTVHILRELGEVIIHGVAMKPGKPVILAKIKETPVIGLPGYPVSAFLAYQNFVSPILTGWSSEVSNDTDMQGGNRELIQATLTRRLVSSLKHREYVRVKVGEVDHHMVATPLARGAGAAMSLVKADGFCILEQNCEGIEAGSQVTVQLTRSIAELIKTVVCIGSHDLILDMISDFMLTRHPGYSLSSTHVGSMGGLVALKNGETHIAPIHLLDENSGQYNIPALKKLFGNESMVLIKGVGRIQGIMVKKGNPERILSIDDLARCRYVNRQRGAGTRLLFDYKLKEAGISPAQINGYSREAANHMAVAAAVKGEGSDAGLGVHSAAIAMDLDFIPIGEEEYDFAVPARFMELPHIKAFIQVLKDSAFQEKISALGGYTLSNCGKSITVL